MPRKIVQSNPDDVMFTKQSYGHMCIWLTNRVRKEKAAIIVVGGGGGGGY